MAWPAVGIVGGGEASAAAQPATGGRSIRHDRRSFGRLEQEDQRLKKHYGRWMDIIQSLELESFILTKVDKGPRPSQLSRPHKSASHHGGSQLAGGVFIFLCVIRRHFWWVRADSAGNVFSRNTLARPVGPSSQGEMFFLQNKVARPVGPCCQVEE